MIRTNAKIEVQVISGSSSAMRIELDEGATVSDAFEIASTEYNFSLPDNATLHVEGERATMQDVLEDGDVVTVTTPKSAGA